MRIKRFSPKLILTVVATVATTLVVHADDKPTRAKVDASKLPPASDKQGLTYTADIKAIFEKSCTKCHGADKQKAKLRLDSLADILKGGEDGKILEPGHSAESLLVASISCVGDEDDWMPPKNNKAKIPPLTPAQIGLIRAWIDQGAK
ncbi:MAG: hypothetical protein DVB25_00650 [Verrucomicrobia bacterium]|nr:MAG: hypothetical protein DVB25_00650 [Verrucomicrobiota bacterium]